MAQLMYVYQDGKPVPLETGMLGGDWSTLVFGGERNVNSTTNNYNATKHESNGTVLQTHTSAVVVSAAPAFLMGVVAHTALAGTLTIAGLVDDTNAARDWVVPIGAVGAILPPGAAVRFEASITMTLSSASDVAKVLVMWRPI